MLLIPYSCDAPLYHRPVGTVGLIVVNTLVFVAHKTGAAPIEPWILAYGDGLHPLQWLLCNFAHGDVFHLLGNMLFLWVFGLVVEGKIGLARFLSCYLAIGMAHAAIVQTIMLGYGGNVEGSLGASAAIFGIMAMACVWAPVNEITVFVLLFWTVAFSFDVSVSVFAACFLGWEVLGMAAHAALVHYFAPDESAFTSSSWLHLVGALLGAPLAILMLKRKAVDCEDWDLLSVLSGDYGRYAQEAREKQPIAPEKIAAKRDAKGVEESRRFAAFVEIGQAAQALAVRRRMQDLGLPLSATPQQLAALAVGLHKEKRWADSAPIMAEYIATGSEHADAMRVKLAQICLMELQRPQKALELLKEVIVERLAPQQRDLMSKIAAVAKQRVAEGECELEDAAW